MTFTSPLATLHLQLCAIGNLLDPLRLTFLAPIVRRLLTLLPRRCSAVRTAAVDRHFDASKASRGLWLHRAPRFRVINEPQRSRRAARARSKSSDSVRTFR